MRGYSDDEIGVIAGFLRQGLSAGKIAAEMSALRQARVTRNAMIGIIRRDKRLAAIGLKSQITLSTGGGRKRVAKAGPSLPYRGSFLAPKDFIRTIGEFEADDSLPDAPVPSRATLQPSAVQPPRNLALVDLGRFDCRFPVNDAAPGEQHLFCGNGRTPVSAYCAHHDLRARGASTPVRQPFEMRAW